MGKNSVYVVLLLICAGTLLSLAVVFVLIFALIEPYKPNFKLEEINERSTLGEGPYWDAGHQRLYWVDMRNMWINSYHPESGDIFKAKVVSEKQPVSLVVRVKDTEDKFVIAVKGSLAMVQWDGKSNKDVTPVEFVDIEDPNSKSRCNDGKVDPSNRLWVGTMGAQTVSDPNGNEFEKDKGSLFRIDHDGKKTQIVENMQIANGLEWSLDGKKFYLVDSLTFLVTEYEYNDKEGTLKKVKDIYDLKAEGLVGTSDKPNTLPDGMTIDNKGLLWIAVYGTGKIIRIDPKEGKKIYEIKLPQVLQPTSVCFGGKNLEILFVTSAYVDWTSEFEEKYPKSGHTFKITDLGVTGIEASRPVRLADSIVNRCCGTSSTETPP